MGDDANKLQDQASEEMGCVDVVDVTAPDPLLVSASEETDGVETAGHKRKKPEGESKDKEEEAPSSRTSHCAHHEQGADGGPSCCLSLAARQLPSEHSAAVLRAPRRLPGAQRCVIVVRSEAHAVGVLGGLQELYLDSSLCDVTLRVDGEDFSAHRVVLAASSDFLRALLAGQWRERNEDIVRIDGIDKRSFRLLLQYIYSGEVVVSGLEELLNLLVAGEHVGLSGLRDMCVERLLEHLSIFNAIQMRLFASEISCPELEQAASKLVLGEFAKVAETSTDFLSLECRQVVEIISSDKVAVDSEEEVLAAVLRWVKHDPEDRKAELPALLSCVRFGLLSETVIETLLLQEPLLTQVMEDFPAFAAQVEEGKRLHQLFEQRQRDLSLLNVVNSPQVPDLPSHQPPELPVELQVEQVRPRTRRERLALLALGGRPAWTRVERFELETLSWTEVSPMLNKRMRHGSSSLEGYIYVVGGKDDHGHALRSVERYDPRNDRWEELAPMKAARTGLGVGALKGLLYAVGGRNEAGQRLKQVECYNPKTRQWTDCPPMNVARGAVRVAALQQCIYAVGGRSETDAALSSVEIFDPETNMWRLVKSMATARVGAGVEVLGGLLYAVGGKDELGNKLRTVERYDPQTDCWEMVPSMGTKRWGAGVAVMSKRLWVIGGMNGAERGALPTLEAFDPEVGKWEEINPGPVLARGSCTFASA